MKVKVEKLFISRAVAREKVFGIQIIINKKHL